MEGFSVRLMIGDFVIIFAQIMETVALPSLATLVLAAITWLESTSVPALPGDLPFGDLWVPHLLGLGDDQLELFVDLLRPLLRRGGCRGVRRHGPWSCCPWTR